MGPELPPLRFLRHGDADVWDLFEGLWHGDPFMIASLALAEELTGKSFVKGRKERRRARERRKAVIWKYERDDF